MDAGVHVRRRESAARFFLVSSRREVRRTSETGKLRDDLAAVLVEDDQSLNWTDFAGVDDLFARRAVRGGGEGANDFFVELEEIWSDFHAVAAPDAELPVDSDRQLPDLFLDDFGHDEKLMDPERFGQTR